MLGPYLRCSQMDLLLNSLKEKEPKGGSLSQASGQESLMETPLQALGEMPLVLESNKGDKWGIGS